MNNFFKKIIKFFSGQKISYQNFILAIQKKVKKYPEIEMVVCGALNYLENEQEKKYDFIRLQSKDIKAEDKILLIRSGVHGNETAGIFTIKNHLKEIFTYAHQNNIKLIIYPIANPSGFENQTRHSVPYENMPGRWYSGDDFVRYELEDGKIIHDLGKSKEFKKWYWSSDSNFNNRFSPEVEMMHQELKKIPLTQICGIVDLHQDYIIPEAPAYAYHYSFDDLNVYEEIIEKIKKIIPLLTNQIVNSGYAKNRGIETDENGFIVRHDGTLPDLIYRLGKKYCITVETTGATAKKIADQVNLIWIKGIIDLIKKEK